MMAEQKNNYDKPETNKFSARMSVFTWIAGAALCWALVVTSFSTVTGSKNGEVITAQNTPSAEDAAELEMIVPAAGGNDPQGN